jgi:hypothetical protein
MATEQTSPRRHCDGPTGGTVLAESTRATRAAPPGETVVYPGTVTTNS